MINTGKLAGVTVFVTGASRGIGKAIALKVAKDGANVIIAAKTAQPHPKLPGTIYTAAQEVEAAGGKCLPCVVDVRDEKQVLLAVEEAVKTFGGIDIVVNNASAISVTGTLDTEMKRYDLMQNINTRGTFLVSKACLPYLKKGKNPHILNLSPPLNLNPLWFKNHVGYTIAKYGMSMCALGMAEEFREDGIAVNALWPRTTIYTSAVEMLSGSDGAKVSRKPEIMADAAYAILCRDSKTFTGNFVIDDDILREEGIIDLDQYAVDPSSKELMPDIFLDLPEEGSQIKPVGGSRISTVFERIKANLTPELVAKTDAVFHFVVKGAEAPDWYIDLKTGTGAAGKGKPSLTADVTLTMNSVDFFDIFSGKVKPAAAFMSGKMKIDGSMQKAMKLERLMGMVKSKL